MEHQLTTKVPGHFWPVAVISLLWNGFGGYDYVMTRQRNVDYLSTMGNSADILAWIDAMPIWAQVLWPIGVWGSVLGAVLLLLRSRLAVLAFLTSLVAAIGSFAGQITMSMPASMDTIANKVMPVVILAVIVFFWCYAKRMLARGVLR